MNVAVLPSGVAKPFSLVQMSMVLEDPLGLILTCGGTFHAAADAAYSAERMKNAFASGMLRGTTNPKSYVPSALLTLHATRSVAFAHGHAMADQCVLS